MKKIWWTFSLIISLAIAPGLLYGSMGLGAPGIFEQQSGPVTVGPYLGFSSGGFGYEADFDGQFYTYSETAEPAAGSIKGGYQFNSFTAIELELALGGNDSEYAPSINSDFEVDVRYFTTIQLRIEYPSYIIPYALFGLTRGRIIYEDANRRHSTISSSPVAGVGVRLPLRSDHRSSIFFETKFLGERIFSRQRPITDDELHQFALGITFGL